MQKYNVYFKIIFRSKDRLIPDLKMVYIATIWGKSEIFAEYNFWRFGLPYILQNFPRLNPNMVEVLNVELVNNYWENNCDVEQIQPNTSNFLPSPIPF